MFRRSNSRELFSLQRETDSKEKGEKKSNLKKRIMDMEIATTFEAQILGLHIVDLLVNHSSQYYDNCQNSYGIINHKPPPHKHLKNIDLIYVGITWP